MRVAVCTNFNGWSRTYSLASVALDQLEMLVRGGYKPVCLVQKGCVNPPEYKDTVEFRELPSVQLSNSGELNSHWQEDVGKLTAVLREVLHDVNICITHDWAYQPAALVYNLSARELSMERPGIRWLNFIHSATSTEIICNSEEVRGKIRTRFPNSYICYPNTGDRARVAKNFQYDEKDVKWVPHPIDLYSFHGFDPLSREFADKYNLLSSDINMVYGVRLDRGKQVQHNISLMAALKRMGKSVRLIVADFHSTGGDKNVYRKELREKASREGLSELEVIFTSEFKPSTNVEVPRSFVRNMLMLSNVFMLASVSETYSLVTAEAAVCGNLVLLNYDFPIMRSIYHEDPYYYKFSSNIDAMSGENGNTVTKYDNPDSYFHAMASAVIGELQHNRVLHLRDFIRKERNLDFVFKNYLEPLFFIQEKKGE